ncbi:MAG TPA: sec-independent translocase [Nocardioides sp.]|nr:sec-independent translocase [Nocardioides sp.]
MFGVGLPELAVIIVVGLLIFGPDRLPDYAKQAGRFIRQVRAFSTATRDDIRRELGPEFADFELTDLDPRRAVRRYIEQAWDETDDAEDDDPPVRAGHRPLEHGERPPYDADAT